MIRSAIFALRTIKPLSYTYYNTARIITNQWSRNFSLNLKELPKGIIQQPLISNKQILDISKNVQYVPQRSVTKFSLKKGKRKSVKAVLKRFYRLEWGGWIRTRAGKHKKIWKKTLANQRRLRQHVLCNSTQSSLLDKMVTKFWKKPKYYVDDPYAPYHTREEFPITRKKPRDIY